MPILLLPVLMVLQSPDGLAQEAEKLYWIIHHMEARPGMNHMFADREGVSSLPIHQVAVDDGTMLNWSLYWVQSSTDPDNDYSWVIVRAYRELEHLNRYAAENAYERAHPGVKPDFPEQQYHDLLREEIWELAVHAADGESGRPGQFAVVDYYDSKPGVNALEMEREMWLPLHRERVKAGVISDWNVFRLLLPSSELYLHDYMTVNFYDDRRSLADFYPTDIVEDALAGRSVDEFLQKTGDARTPVKQETWYRWLTTE